MVNILILTYIWRLEQITSKIVAQKKDRFFFEWWSKEFHCESSVLKFIKVAVFCFRPYRFVKILARVNLSNAEVVREAICEIKHFGPSSRIRYRDKSGPSR
jgi:hypothetical protein